MADKHQKPITYLQSQLSSESVTPVIWAAARASGEGRTTAVYTSTSLGMRGKAQVRAAYPGSTWKRLVEIKSRYDPTNLFRLNQNIPPGI